MRDLTQVDGVTVVERTKAKMQGVGLSGANGAEISTVDEVLLEDERVVYQCVHPDDEDCVFHAPSVRSVTAHQRSHGRSALRRQLSQRDAELTEMKTKATQIRENRRRGAERAAQTKKAKRLALPAEVGNPGKPEDTLSDLETASRRVVTAFNAMQESMDEFQRVFLGYMRLAATSATPTTPDPELVAKAQKWDKYIEFQEFVAGAKSASSSESRESRDRAANRRNGK